MNIFDENFISRNFRENLLSIDLHGKSVKEAKSELSKQFSQASDLSRMTIITGLGRHSKGGFGVLFKKTVPDFLKRPEIKDRIQHVQQDMGAYVISFKQEKNTYDETVDKIKKILQPFLFSSSETLEITKKKALQGSIDDQFSLHIRYIDGYGVPQDVKEAMFWMEKAATNGHREAQMLLGCMYETGINVKQNYEKARHWHGKAAEGDHPHSLYTIGKYYWLGLGVIKNDSKAIEYFTKSAELKNLDAAFNLGSIYLEGFDTILPDQQKARQYLTQAAEGGIRDAQVLLAKQFFFGYGSINQDLDQARHWFLMAAKDGDMIAQYYVGRIYVEGLGVEIDYKKGFESFEKSASQGDKDAQATIACALINGIHYKQDAVKGVAQLKELADKGHPQSAGTLGLYLFRGIDKVIKSDLKQAVDYLTIAANLKHVEPQKILARLYFSKESGITDPVKGEHWLREAARQNDAEALYELGIFLETTDQAGNLKHEIVDLYTRSAAQEFPDAQFTLGISYINGDLVEIDEEKGLSLLKSAAKLKNVLAQFEIGRILITRKSEDDKRTGVSYFASAAKTHPPAMTGLAICYRNGIGIPKDADKAHSWFEKAAEHDDAFALNYLGLYHLEKKQGKQAFTAFSRAAQLGMASAKINLAICYLEGKGVKRDVSKAIEWLEDAATGGNGKAEYYLGYIFSNQSFGQMDINKAIEWLKKSVSHGYEQAESLLKFLSSVSSKFR